MLFEKKWLRLNTSKRMHYFGDSTQLADSEFMN